VCTERAVKLMTHATDTIHDEALGRAAQPPASDDGHGAVRVSRPRPIVRRDRCQAGDRYPCSRGT
jgi:hypothetical protein